MKRLNGQLQPQVRLMQRLTDLEMNYAELARVLGVSPMAVSYWCRGVRRPGAAQARNVAKALGAPFGAVWTYEPPAGGETDEC